MHTKSSEIDWQSMFNLLDVDRKIDSETASICLYNPESIWCDNRRELTLVAQLPSGLHTNVYQAAAVWQISELLFALHGAAVASQTFMQWILHEAVCYDGVVAQGEDVDNELRFGSALVDMLHWNIERKIGPDFASQCRVVHGLYDDPRSFIYIRGGFYAVALRKI